MTRKKTLQYVLFTITLIFAFFLWRSIDYSIKITDVGFWFMPILWLSLVFLSFSLTAIILDSEYLLWLLSSSLLLLSFVFVWSYWHIVIVFVSALFLIMADDKIKKDLTYAIKINIWKSIRAGSLMVVFSLALVLASQYYFEVRNFPVESLLPKFNADGVTGRLVSWGLKYSIPSLHDLDQENLTVDQMLLNNQAEQIENINAIDKIKIAEGLSEIDAAIIKEESDKLKENNRNIILAESRKQLSQTVGQELKGDENVSDVFTLMINKKISQTLVPKIGEGKTLPIIPLVISVALFVTVFSLGCTVTPIWILFCYFVFYLFKKFRIITIVEVPAKIEMIK